MRKDYLIRAEMAKAIQNTASIEGKVWDCSQNIKVSYFEIQAYGDITSRLASAAACKEIEVKEFERCTVYQINNSRDAASFLPYLDRQFYNQHIENMRTYQRLKPDIHTFSTS